MKVLHDSMLASLVLADGSLFISSKQGHGYVDPLRYLGVACVISGSFCVCLAMCRWLGRPISVSSHRVAGLGGIDYQVRFFIHLVELC